MNWSFAIINNKLAEVHFQKDKSKIKFLGHCYVQKSDYKTKIEQKWIKKDTAKIRLVYRNRQYKRCVPNISKTTKLS